MKWFKENFEWLFKIFHILIVGFIIFFIESFMIYLYMIFNVSYHFPGTFFGAMKLFFILLVAAICTFFVVGFPIIFSLFNQEYHDKISEWFYEKIFKE